MDMHDWMAGLRGLLRHGRTQPVPSRARPARHRPPPMLSSPPGTPPPTSAPAEPMLRLYLFGPLRVYVGGELVIDEHFTRRKAKALLVLLYLERGRHISRDELLERLW